MEDASYPQKALEKPENRAILIYVVSIKKICGVCKSDFLANSKLQTICSYECRREQSRKRTGRIAMFPGIPTATIGSMSEMEVAINLMKKGYCVFRALSPAAFCDLIVVKDLEIIRIEARTGYVGKNNQLTFTKEMHGKIDLFGVYFPKADSVKYYKPIPNPKRKAPDIQEVNL